jgi:hypothetical protein
VGYRAPAYSEAVSSAVTRLPRALGALVLAALFAFPERVRAESSPAGPIAVVAPAAARSGSSSPPAARDAKAEAAWRFDRGVQLYNESAFAAARAEFQRALDLTDHVVVRLNLGLVQAKLGNSVEAVRLLEPLSERESGLDESRRTLAKNVAAEHRGRLGTLHIETNVTDAVIQLDNVEVAKAPAPPIAVGAGTHLISVFAPDYEPRRLEVVVPSRATQRVAVELLPLQETLAHLEISSSTPDVQVYAGGLLVGRTPFDSSVAFKPGVHELRFSRAGYLSQTREVTLHPGGTGALEIQLEPDPNSAARASLRVRVSERQAVVWIDGQARIDFERGVELPLGRHHLRVQRSGYQELSREVDVLPSGSRIDLELFPTAEGLADYVDNAETERRWAYITLGAGALVAASSGAFVVYNNGEERQARRDFDAAIATASRTTSGSCDDRDCEEVVRQSADALDAVQRREPWGWAGVGLGAAALGAGFWMLLTADDPDRYGSESEELTSPLSFSVNPTGATLGAHF